MDRALAYKIFSNLFGEDGLLSQGPTSNVVATNRGEYYYPSITSVFRVGLE